MKPQNQVEEYSLDYVLRLDRNSKGFFKRTHADNSEYSLAVKKVLVKIKIRQTKSSGYLEGWNGLTERTNHALLRKARTLLKEAGMSEPWSGDAVEYAEVFRNWNWAILA